MNKCLFIATAVVAALMVVSCSKEPKVKYVTETLTLGHEGWISTNESDVESTDTKTFLANNASSGKESTNNAVYEIRWGSVKAGKTGIDTYVYVFDNENDRYQFIFDTPTDVNHSSTRDFVCDNWIAGRNKKFVIWTGTGSTTDAVLSDNYLVTGSTLQLRNSQSINNTSSFAQTVNITVMRSDKDDQLRSVFGYLRFTNPKRQYNGAYLDKGAAIKQVDIKTKNNDGIAGQVRIDYSGADPTVQFEPGATLSSTITVTTRVKDKDQEVGYVYVAMLPGTYKDLVLHIYTVKGAQGNPVDDTDFYVIAQDDIVIERGKYTDIGTLPTASLAPPAS